MGYWTDVTIHVPIQLPIFISQAISIAWDIHAVDYMSDHKTHHTKSGSKHFRRKKHLRQSWDVEKVEPEEREREKQVPTVLLMY